jgi:hypothetical protein
LEKAETNLNVRKEHLWKTKEVAKWELDPKIAKDADILLQDKEAASKFMLPRQTSEVLKLKRIYAYYNFMAKNEIQQALERRVLMELQHFTKFANAMEEKA